MLNFVVQFENHLVNAITYLVKASKNLNPKQIAAVIKEVWPRDTTSRAQDREVKDEQKVKVDKSKP